MEYNSRTISTHIISRPPSPLARKRTRIDAQPDKIGFASAGFNNDNMISASSFMAAPLPSGGFEMKHHTAAASESQTPMNILDEAGAANLRIDTSLAELEVTSHAIRMALAAKEQSDKGTANSYTRHVNNYLKWWASYQAGECQQNPSRIPLPAEPITAAKVAMFLNYETTWLKVCRAANVSLQQHTHCRRCL